MSPVGVSRPRRAHSAQPPRPAPTHPRLAGRLAAGFAPVGMLLLLGIGAPRAGASSPEAWRAYDQEVRSACLKATRLSQARVIGDRVDVPVADATPTSVTPLISALLLEGRYPQAHMHSRKGRELCLFEQRTRRATVAEADQLERPRSRTGSAQP